MDYLYIKSLHIIFIVTWFAGLFYIVRLFIYQTEALAKDEPDKTILFDQFGLMARRLWLGITWPSAILTLIFGTWLIIREPSWLSMPFMHVKLTFVALLYLYQFSCQHIFNTLQNGIAKYSSNQLRIWNEVATIILVAVVFLIVMKSHISWIWGVIGIVLFSIMLMLAIKIYRGIRSRYED